MPHDIIDNRDQKLVDHINCILGSTDSARFAVGYFFLSGLQAIQANLTSVRSLRLLIGNTTNRETIEQISEGYKRLELVEAAEEREKFLKKAEHKHRLESTAGNLRRTVELMDQTDDGEALVRTLIQLIEEKRLEVKVYTKGRLHAKAYIFDYKDGPYEKGIAVVGSSNLTLSGLTHNTELNVVVHGNDNHERLGKWFDALWDDAQDFEAHLMDELKQSWAAALATPYDIYMKTLYSLVADRLEDGEGKEILWDDEITRSLADFQKVAVRQAIQMIRDHGGAFVSDVVGLGKSYIGAGIVKHFERTQGARPLIICPKPLVDMWEDYNETFLLNARVLPMSLLKEEEDGQSILDHTKFKDRDFVLIDESHNFRHQSSQRYEVLQDYLAKGGRKVCLLTATPRNKSARDVYNQIKLFHQDDITHLPIDPPNLKEFFKQIDEGKKRLQDLLVHLLIRRTRRHIVRYYGFTEDTHQPMRELADEKAKVYLNGTKRAYVMVAGKHQFFPKRELETLRYSIEDTYKGLYAQIRAYLGKPLAKGVAYTPKPGKELTYARYGLWHYVKPAKQKVAPYTELHRAGINLRGLIRVMLFKRFESSVYAFRKTLERLERMHEMFLKALDQGIVPAGEDAQKILYESDRYEESDLMDALAEATGTYKLEDFDEKKLHAHLEADLKVLSEILTLVRPIKPDKDAKLQTLIAGLKKGIPQKTGKVLIFTQYSDTAFYLYQNLNPGSLIPDIESIYGTDKSKSRMAARFSPSSNPHVKIGADSEIRILIATDVMSEGLNLQDGDVVLNYDLHWNPVRLIQRFGRIDRIGARNDVIWGFNFLPETAMEKQLGLHQVLAARIKEIQETIGEDAAILDKDEQVNEEGMYCIYEKKNEQLSFFEDEEGDFVDINEAEEMLRSLQTEDPAEFARIAALRDGIRSARAMFTAGGGRFVFCQAGKYQQLFLYDAEGKIVSRDIPKVLSRLKCSKKEPATMLPKDHNQEIMKALSMFSDEVRHRTAQQQFSLSLTVGQTYALRELRSFHATLDPEEAGDLRAQIAILEESFKQPLTAAIKKQLNTIRRNALTGRHLVKTLSDLYHDHGMSDRDFQFRHVAERESENLPRVICSEAFV
jgi:superfamily II DNA or RNA helicase